MARHANASRKDYHPVFALAATLQGDLLSIVLFVASPHGVFLQPSIVLLPTVLHDKDGERSKQVLAPFREGEVKPVFEKVGTVPDMNTVSHGADMALKLAPKRLFIRGTAFADFYPELLYTVWERWVHFTEENDDARATAILFDFTRQDKWSSVPPEETACSKRTPHYWTAVQGRSATDESVPAVRQFVTEIVRFVREKSAEFSGQDLGWLLSMCQGDENPEDVFGDSLPRLRKIKAKYDPEKVWKKGCVIEPLFE